MKNNKNLNYYSALKYKIELSYNTGDNKWTAAHPELGAGSCYAIGDTQEEAIKKLKEEADKEGVSLNQYVVFVLAESTGKVQQGFKHKGLEVSTDFINEAREKYSGV